LLCAAFAPAHADERITRFVSDVAVQTSGDVLVTETISLRAEGAIIKHGITRDFPTIYTKHDGTEVEVAFDVLGVTRDGAPENYTLEQLSNGWRVRIGRADTLVSPGNHDYAIKYRTSRQIGFFADFDELYWNATGTGWNFWIDSAEARISLRRPSPSPGTRFTPARRAPTDTTPRSSSSAPATSCSALQGRCRHTTA